MALGFANRGGIVVLRAAVVAEVHLRGGIGVGEPACGVAPAQQQRQIQPFVGGIAQGPHEHRQRIAGALVIAGQNRAEGLAAHLGVIDAFVVGPAERITGGIGAAAALGCAGGVPAPARQWLAGIGAGGIALGLHRQGVGTAAFAVAFKQAELAIGQYTKPVLAAVEVPEIDIAIRRPADAPGSESPQGHAVVGTVVEVAGVANGVRSLPAQAQGAAPAGLRRLPTGGARAAQPLAAQQRFQGRQAKARHGAAEGAASLSELAGGRLHPHLLIHQCIQRDG